MDPEDENAAGTSGAPAGTATATPPPPPSASQSILDSPEYKELAKQNRQLARDAGRAKAAEEAARAEAERIRLAAEATQQAAMEQQIAEILGDDGVDEWNRIAELAGAGDQVEAAKALRALMTKATGAQSPAAAAPATSANPGEGAPVTTPSGSRSVGADAPLSAPQGSETSQIITQLESNWTAAVERNQNPDTRNRMTMRDRAEALIGYVGAAYLKAGAKAKDRS